MLLFFNANKLALSHPPYKGALMWQQLGQYEYEVDYNGKYTGWYRCVGGRLANGHWPKWNYLTGGQL